MISRWSFSSMIYLFFTSKKHWSTLVASLLEELGLALTIIHKSQANEMM